MSADRLREAARVLRERADRAYGEPWRADPPNAVVWTGNDDEFPTVYVNGGLYANQGRTAAYIATMHPGVGLALADWLDDAAANADFMQAVIDAGRAENPNATLKRTKADNVADLILGAES